MFQHTEDEDLFLLAAPPAGGRTLLQADVSAVALAVYDAADLETTVHTATLYAASDPSSVDKTQCMFAALQEDDTWPHTDGGYSFWTVIDDGDFHLVAGTIYKIVVSLTAGTAAPTWPELDDYGTVKIEWDVECVASP